MSAAFVLAWRFTVAAERRAEFERIYGADGDWARLFRRHAGFLGTQLLVGADGIYLTLDRWRSEADWIDFKHAHAEAYAALDRACEALTLAEERLGAFAAEA
jgi:heme-degrading monooxygenase HmoA